MIRLRLPSLRERREDIPLLARYFLNQSAHQLGVDSKRLSDQAMHFLSTLDLPGNVRQLENLCNWITVMAPGQTVEIKDLPPEMTAGVFVPSASSSTESLGETEINGSYAHVSESSDENPLSRLVGGTGERTNWILMLEAEAAHMLSAGKPEVMDALGKQFESALIKTALKHTHGRKNDAAIRLGIGRNTITRKIQELGIEGGKDD